MMLNKSNPVTVNLLRQQIEVLLREYPELADDEFLRADMLEGVTDLHGILLALHRMVDDAKGMRDGTQSRLDDLLARKARFAKRMDFGRALILQVLQSADLRKVELPEVTLSMRNNPPKLLGEPDADTLPDHLVKIVRTPDKLAIKAALEAGEDVPNCTLSNSEPSLMVRVK